MSSTPMIGFGMDLSIWMIHIAFRILQSASVMCFSSVFWFIYRSWVVILQIILLHFLDSLERFCRSRLIVSPHGPRTCFLAKINSKIMNLLLWPEKIIIVIIIVVSENDLHIFGLPDYLVRLSFAVLVFSCRIQSLIIFTYQSFQKWSYFFVAGYSSCCEDFQLDLCLLLPLYPVSKFLVVWTRAILSPRIPSDIVYVVLWC